MEIVIGILILIGALAIGSNASTLEDSQAEKHVAESEQTVIESGVDTAQAPCRFQNGQLVQRDLTVPRAPAAPFSGGPTEKPGYACSDE